MMVRRRASSFSPKRAKAAAAAPPLVYRSPQPLDGRRTLTPIEREVELNLLYVYVNALRSDPPLLKTIGPFLDDHPQLYADAFEKTRLGKQVHNWDRNPHRQSPSDTDAKLAAAYIKKLQHQRYFQQARRMSAEDDTSSVNSAVTEEIFPHDDPPAKPPKVTTSKSKKAPTAFKPAAASFNNMSADPPTVPTDPWGFDVNELKLNDLFADSGQQIVPINPEDPASLPPGYFAFEGMVLVPDKGGTKVRVKKTAVLAVMPSPEAAKIVAAKVPKLKKNGQGFAFEMPHHDPNFVRQFDEVVATVASKTAKTEQDPDGTVFTSQVRTISFYFVIFDCYISN